MPRHTKGFRNIFASAMKMKIIYILNIIFLLFIAESRSYTDFHFNGNYQNLSSHFHGKKSHPNQKIDRTYSKKNLITDDTVLEISDIPDHLKTTEDLLPVFAAYTVFSVVLPASLSECRHYRSFHMLGQSVKTFLYLRTLRI